MPRLVPAPARLAGGADGAALGCAHHGCLRVDAEPLATPANLVTALRTVLAVALAAVALAQATSAPGRATGLLLASLAVYWVGDVLDGAVARWTDRETRTGAVLDVVCDRLCAALFYVGWVVLHPADVLPVTVFLVQFMVVDCLLSLSFLAWPLRSPNYFDLVDRPVFALNWSKPAKATNSAALALLLVLTDALLVPLLLTSAVLAVKAWSLVRVSRLPAPPRAGCAAG